MLQRGTTGKVEFVIFHNLNLGVKRRGESMQRLRGKAQRCGMVKALQIYEVGAENLLGRKLEKLKLVRARLLLGGTSSRGGSLF